MIHISHVEEKVLAIEEIRREESKSKLLLAEAMAAGNCTLYNTKLQIFNGLCNFNIFLYSKFGRREF